MSVIGATTPMVLRTDQPSVGGMVTCRALDFGPLPAEVTVTEEGVRALARMLGYALMPLPMPKAPRRSR